ncbi:hypothetical protein LTS12_028179, partial [Elasticomyces elasticus]
GEAHLNDQIERNMSLLNQLGDVDTEITNSRRRVRELEKEIASLKESGSGSGSTVGLEGSRWASEGQTEGGQTQEPGQGPAEGEDRGPSIEGT